MIITRNEFRYEQDGVKLAFGFDQGLLEQSQMKIFLELLDRAREELASKIIV